MNRVVVTGMGIVSTLGTNLTQFSQNIKAGVSGVIEKKFNIAGQMKSILCSYLKEYDWDNSERTFQMAENAARQALKMGKCTNLDLSSKRAGVFAGTATGCIPFYENVFKSLTLNKDAEVNTNLNETFSLYPYHGVVQKLSESLEISHCKLLTFNSACASSNLAITYASQMIRRGILDTVLVVGVDALSEYDLMGFNSLGILTSKMIRPFDAQRDGIVLGEGAAALLLESAEHASQRKANIVAEIMGAGISNEAYKLATPDPEGKGAALSMKNALLDSRLSSEEIDYINAHGTGTVLNDEMETQAIKKVFGEKAYSIPISSSKSMLGHTRGASGAIEAIICILAIQGGFAPPTINYKNRDDKCDLNYVPGKSIPARLKNVISNSFGFGGHCSSVIFSKI